MKLTLNKVIEILVDEIREIDKTKPYTTPKDWYPELYKYILKDIKIRTTNRYRKLYNDKSVGFDKNLSTNLKETILIESSFLVYNYCGHEGWRNLYVCKDIEDIETEILCGSGYLNMFTTDLLVIIDGVIKHFNVVANKKDGKKVVYDRNSRKDELNFDLSINKGRTVHITRADGLEYDKDYVESMLEGCLNPEDYEELFNIRVEWLD